MRLFPKMAGIAAATATAVVVPLVGAAAFGETFRGYDVSWPQCGDPLPVDGDFRIVGVSGGRPYEDNDCLGGQYRWATATTPGVAFYMNTANPGTAARAVAWYAERSPDPACSPSNEAACAFNYGYNAARHAFAFAEAQTGAAGKWSWWLDVETGNSWSPSVTLNVADLIGSIAYLRSQGVPVGVYSTDHQWGRITGRIQFPDVPNWVAGARNAREAASWCAPDSSFTGGPVVLVQWEEGGFDHDHACGRLPVATGPPQSAAPTGVEKVVGDVLSLLSQLLGPK